MHTLTPVLIINHPLSASSIYCEPWHPPCSIYMLDSLFAQPMSKFSLVYLLVWHPPLHTPYISSPNHCLLFTGLAHAIKTCFAVVPRLYHLILISFLNSLLGTLSFILMPHIHLTILISACWNATSFSLLTGQVSLPCNILLCAQLLYNFPLTVNDISLLVSNDTNCLSLYHPTGILATHFPNDFGEDLFMEHGIWWFFVVWFLDVCCWRYRLVCWIYCSCCCWLHCSTV